MRAFFRALFGLILRIFFRRIEVSGIERVPPRGPVMFVLNHPSGLIDPAFLLCRAPRPVPLAPGEEPPAGPVRELTARIERALAAVTLQAEQTEAHALVERAQRILSAQDAVPAMPPTLSEEFALRRRLLAGYAVVRAQR